MNGETTPPTVTEHGAGATISYSTSNPAGQSSIEYHTFENVNVGVTSDPKCSPWSGYHTIPLGSHHNNMYCN